MEIIDGASVKAKPSRKTKKNFRKKYDRVLSTQKSIYTRESEGKRTSGEGSVMKGRREDRFLESVLFW